MPFTEEDRAFFQRKVRHIETQLHTLEQGFLAMAATLADLTADVAAQSTVIDSLDTLLGNLATLIASLKTNQTDPATAAAIDALATQVTQNTSRISADVVKNTPAAS